MMTNKLLCGFSTKTAWSKRTTAKALFVISMIAFSVLPLANAQPVDTIVFSVGDLNLGTVQVNQTFPAIIVCYFLGSSLVVNSATFSTNFASWLKSFPTQTLTSPLGSEQIQISLAVPSWQMPGNYSGTFSVQGIDSYGTTHIATGEVTAIVGSTDSGSSMNDIPAFLRNNPTVIVILILAILAVCCLIAVYSRRI